MNPVITNSTMLNSHWHDTLSEINTPDLYIEPVQMFFVDSGANTPLQFIGQLLVASFTNDGARMNEDGFIGLLRRYRGDNHSNQEVRRHIRRTLYALVNVMSVRLNINMYNENIYVMDELATFEEYLYADEVNAGGNKKKKSAKRKSSKKRSTRSKKRVSSA